MKLASSIICVFMLSSVYSGHAFTLDTPNIIKVARNNVHINLVFSEHDRDLVHRYYDGERKIKGKQKHYGKRKQMPPGLAKKRHLPPGLQKQLHKNGKLPPGLEGRYLPHRLERYLDPLPENYARLRVGTDIILLDLLTKTILDVINNAAF